MTIDINFEIGEELIYEDGVYKKELKKGVVSAITIRKNLDKRLFLLIEMKNEDNRTENVFTSAFVTKDVKWTITKPTSIEENVIEEVKPLSPSDVKTNKKVHPDIIWAVNELLKERYKKGIVTILQKDIVAKFKTRNPEYYIQDLYDSGSMNFEPIYRAKGWKVEYDKPAYNESYDAYFTFSEK